MLFSAFIAHIFLMAKISALLIAYHAEFRESTMFETKPLLKTKFIEPAFRTNTINRSRLTDQLLKTADYDFAADLLEENAATLFNKGEQKNLTRWIEQIPSAIIENRPRSPF